MWSSKRANLSQEVLVKIVNRGQFHQHFTSSFYECRSTKAQKDTDNLTVFFALLGSWRIKASSKHVHVGEIDQDFHFSWRRK